MSDAETETGRVSRVVRAGKRPAGFSEFRESVKRPAVMPACVLDLVTCRLCRELLHVGLVVGLFTFVNTWEIEPVVGSGCGWGHPKTVPVHVEAGSGASGGIRKMREPTVTGGCGVPYWVGVAGFRRR